MTYIRAVGIKVLAVLLLGGLLSFGVPVNTTRAATCGSDSYSLHITNRSFYIKSTDSVPLTATLYRHQVCQSIYDGQSYERIAEKITNPALSWMVNGSTSAALSLNWSDSSTSKINIVKATYSGTGGPLTASQMIKVAKSGSYTQSLVSFTESQGVNDYLGQASVGRGLAIPLPLKPEIYTGISSDGCPDIITDQGYTASDPNDMIVTNTTASGVVTSRTLTFTNTLSYAAPTKTLTYTIQAQPQHLSNGTCAPVDSPSVVTTKLYVHVTPLYFGGLASVIPDGTYQAVFTNGSNSSVNLAGNGYELPFGQKNADGTVAASQITFVTSVTIRDATGSLVTIPEPLDKLDWSTSDVNVIPAGTPTADQMHYVVQFGGASHQTGIAAVSAKYSGNMPSVPQGIVGTSASHNLAIWNVAGTLYTVNHQAVAGICDANSSLYGGQTLTYDWSIDGPAEGELVNTATGTASDNQNSYQSQASAVITAPERTKLDSYLGITQQQLAAKDWPRSTVDEAFQQKKSVDQDFYDKLDNQTTLSGNDFPFAMYPIDRIASFKDQALSPVQPNLSGTDGEPHTFVVTKAPSSGGIISDHTWKIDWLAAFLPNQHATNHVVVQTLTPSISSRNAYMTSFVRASFDPTNTKLAAYPPVYFGLAGCVKSFRVIIEGDVYTGTNIRSAGIQFKPISDDSIVVVGRGGTSDLHGTEQTLKQLAAYTFDSPDLSNAKYANLSLEHSVILDRFRQFAASHGDAANDHFNLDYQATQLLRFKASNSTDIANTTTLPCSESSYGICYQTDSLTGEQALVIRGKDAVHPYLLYLNPARATCSVLGGTAGLYGPYAETLNQLNKFNNPGSNCSISGLMNDKTNPEGRIWFTQNELILNNVVFFGRGSLVSAKSIQVLGKANGYLSSSNAQTYLFGNAATPMAMDGTDPAGQQDRSDNRTAVGIAALRGDLVCDPGKRALSGSSPTPSVQPSGRPYVAPAQETCSATATTAQRQPTADGKPDQYGLPLGWKQAPASTNSFVGSYTLSTLLNLESFKSQPIIRALSFDGASQVAGSFFAPLGSANIGTSGGTFHLNGALIAAALRFNRTANDADVMYLTFDQISAQICPPHFCRLVSPVLSNR